MSTTGSISMQVAGAHSVDPGPNQSLQPTANPLRGLSAAELGRYAERNVTEMHPIHEGKGCDSTARV